MSDPHSRLRSPPFPEGRGLCWMMDSATSPSAPRRMTGWVLG